MVETFVKCKITNPKTSKGKEIDFFVDTGATYTTVPSEILETLGIKKTDKIQIELGNEETIERYIGTVLVELEGRKSPTPVIFGEEKDAVVLGVVTLEECRLTVDSVNKKLVPVTKVHHYKLDNSIAVDTEVIESL